MADAIILKFQVQVGEAVIEYKETVPDKHNCLDAAIRRLSSGAQPGFNFRAAEYRRATKNSPAHVGQWIEIG